MAGLVCFLNETDDEREGGGCTALDDALAFALSGPRTSPKLTSDQQDKVLAMSRHCQGHEDVGDAAARILAVEVVRLRVQNAPGETRA